MDCQGKYGEAVYGSALVSVARYLSLKIDSRRHLTELDTNKDRNWTIIESNEEAKSWERRFAEIAPPAAEAFAREFGIQMLERTAHARDRASSHLRRLLLMKGIHEQIESLVSAGGRDLRAQAERLAAWPGVMQLYGAEDIYLLACCAVLSGDEESSFAGQDPLVNDELMWQIQLVVDGILAGEE